MTPSFVPTRLHRFPALLAGDGEERPLGVEPRIGLALRGFNQPVLSLGSGELSKQGRVKTWKKEKEDIHFKYFDGFVLREKKNWKPKDYRMSENFSFLPLIKPDSRVGIQ